MTSAKIRLCIHHYSSPLRGIVEYYMKVTVLPVTSFTWRVSKLSQHSFSELFSIASVSVMTFILKAIVFEKRRAFGMMINNSNERDTRLLWNVSQFVTMLCFCSLSDQFLVFTSSLIRFFPMFSVRFGLLDGRLQSWISLPAYSRWFYFFWEQHESVGRSPTFRVSTYSRDRLIGEETR